MNDERKECEKCYLALRDKVRQYLQYDSIDGKPIRQALRKELSELVGISLHDSRNKGEDD
jgi:hypothetical protein